MNIFKRIFSNKINKTFNYSLKLNGETVEYSYSFEVKKNMTEEDIIKICYKEFINKHSIDMIDNIIKVSLK